jgi:hypothetical protein
MVSSLFDESRGGNALRSGVWWSETRVSAEAWQRSADQTTLERPDSRHAKKSDADNRKDRDIGYAPAVNSARESATWIRAPSRSLMRLLLSQHQTPAFPRRFVGFFGSGPRASRPAFGITQLTSDWQRYLKPTLSAVDGTKIKLFRKVVNARFWCNWRVRLEPAGVPDRASIKAFGESPATLP